MNYLRAILALVCTFNLAGCASFSVNPANWSMPTLAGGSTAAPGTADWWDDHKDEAELVVGKGWQVEGVEGFFDDQGRPIRTKVAKVVRDNETKKATVLEDIQVADSFNQMKEKIGLGPDQNQAKALYAEGEALYRSKDFKAAADKFESAAKRWPDSAVEQDAYFYLAESQFFSKQYPEAVDTYGLLLEKYPNSQHLDRIISRQFDIARYWEQYHQFDPEWVTTPNITDETRPLFDTVGRALKTYDNIRLNDPTGPLADDAIMASANSYFLRGLFADADYHYQLLREQYPRSEHQFEAHILGLQCKLQLYQGEDYVDTPLQEAKKIVKQLKVQFSGDLSAEERQRLGDVQAQLNQKLAERELKMARYYDDGKYYGSAKFYYAQIAKNYPNTPVAEVARARYVELGGEPEKPEEPLKWLVDMVPENSERQKIKQVPLIERSDNTRLATEPQNPSTDASSLYR